MRVKTSVVPEQRFVFDEVAEEYARVRPSYPAELVEDLIAAAGLREGARVLEIGCGPGNASVLFAGRGYRMLCLEPGPHLAAIARQRLGDAAEVEVTTFEEWPLERGAFDLVFAAQSFHWVDPRLAFGKSAHALAPGGTLAIFGNRPLVDGDTALHRELREAYARHASGIVHSQVGYNSGDNLRRLLDESGSFEPAQSREYPWQRDYTTDDYLTLLGTQSDHRMLPASELETLLDALRAVVDRHGGIRPARYVAALGWARVQSS